MFAHALRVTRLLDLTMGTLFHGYVQLFMRQSFLMMDVTKNVLWHLFS